uniref:Uncharacterized protein n=1 Tax=Suricata suricatta TaxID=37032 RepID=A0A673V906_SURSU
MGGGRGLLGREPLGPGGGCSEEEALSPWPPLRWPGRAVPRAAVPSRVVLAFVPGIALQVPAAAAESAPQVCAAAGPLPYSTLGLGPALQLQAGLPLHARPTTHSQATAESWDRRNLLKHHKSHLQKRPALWPLAPPTARHGQTEASSHLDPAKKRLSCHGLLPLDRDPAAHHPPLEGRASLSPAAGPIPCLLLETSSALTRWPPVPGVPGSQMQSLVFARGPVSFAQNPVLFSIRIVFVNMCLLVIILTPSLYTTPDTTWTNVFPFFQQMSDT